MDGIDIINWTTPIASDSKGCYAVGHRRRSLAEAVYIWGEAKGPMSPAWVSQLMGLPEYMRPSLPGPELSIGSLFSGIGALDFGVEGSGLGHVVWQCESNKYARKVLSKHWEGVTRYEDIVGLSPPTCDILIGGFPCTDLSVANQRGEGLRGKRSGLWYEMLRIIEDTRPVGVIVENSGRLVRRGLVEIRGQLEGAGYSVETTRIRASDIGAPHKRERLFIVAYRHDGGVRDRFGGVYSGSDVQRARRIWLDMHSWPAGKGSFQYDFEHPRVVRARGCKNRESRVRGLGNAVVPQVGFVVACRLYDLLSSTSSGAV